MNAQNLTASPNNMIVSPSNEATISLFKKIHAAASSIAAVKKDATLRDYKAVSAEGSIPEMKNALLLNGLVLIPGNIEIIHHGDHERPGKNGASYVTKTFGIYTFGVADTEGGAMVIGSAPGEAQNYGDKGSAGSYTSALKHFLMKLLMIPGKDDPELLDPVGFDPLDIAKIVAAVREKVPQASDADIARWARVSSLFDLDSRTGWNQYSSIPEVAGIIKANREAEAGKVTSIEDHGGGVNGNKRQVPETQGQNAPASPDLNAPTKASAAAPEPETTPEPTPTKEDAQAQAQNLDSHDTTKESRNQETREVSNEGYRNIATQKDFVAFTQKIANVPEGEPLKFKEILLSSNVFARTDVPTPETIQEWVAGCIFIRAVFDAGLSLGLLPEMAKTGIDLKSIRKYDNHEVMLAAVQNYFDQKEAPAPPAGIEDIDFALPYDMAATPQTEDAEEIVGEFDFS